MAPKILASAFRTILCLISLITVSPVVLGHKELPLEKLNLKPGFEISVYAEVVNPRQMALSSNGVLFVGSRRAGSVYAITDDDGDHQADQVFTIAEDLLMPSGVAVRGTDLYVGVVDRIVKFTDVANSLSDPPKSSVAVSGLPEEQHHGWKYLDFGPDGKLYLNIGAPCNICLSEDPMFATIASADISVVPPEVSVFAHGVRNSVGFTWHPETMELWFTDNGRDLLGDFVPAGELNRAPKAGMHFGYPYIHAGPIHDPEFGAGKLPSGYTAPELKLDPHVAPLGLLFYTGDMFPEEYKNRILMAEHGSWNRTLEAGHTGYRLTMATSQPDGSLKYETFIDGWLENNLGWGRPADLLQLPDGSLLIADDTRNVIYRVTYSAPGTIQSQVTNSD